MALNIPIKQAGDQLTAGEFNEVVSEINQKADQSSLSGLASVSDLSAKADKTGVYTKSEVDDKVAGMSGTVISLTETEAGKLSYGGKDHVIHRLTAELSGLPATAGSSVDVVISDQPLGDSLFLSVESLSVASPAGFPVSAYKVDRVYVDSDMNTVASVTCEKAVSGDTRTLLTIRYVRGLLSFDVFELSIPLSELGVSSADEVTVEIPALKYDKRFAVMWEIDDSLSAPYSAFFKYTHKKWVDYNESYREFLDKDTNGAKSPRGAGEFGARLLCHTDGCGNDIPFKYGSAWISYNNNGSDGIHNDTSFPYQYISWRELVKFMDFGNYVSNHGGGDQSNEMSSIRDNQLKVEEKTGKGMYVFVLPGGTSWSPYPERNFDWFVGRRTRDAPVLTDVDNITLESISSPFSCLRIDNDLKDANVFANYKALIDKAHGEVSKRYILFANHNIKFDDVLSDGRSKWQNVRDTLDYVYDTYGKGGDDSVWFPSSSEFVEYLISRALSVMNKSISNGRLVLRCKMLRMYGFNFKQTSVLIAKKSGAIPSGAKTIAAGANIINMTSSVKDGGLLINLDWNAELIRLAEKYTAIYELEQTDDARHDALFMCGRLKTDLANPFLARINAGETAPVLRSVSINSGSSTTYDRDVSVTLGVTGPITHYKASESPDLSGAGWIAGTSKTLSLNLSSGLGTKTVYVQVKNQYGESGVKSSSITLQERPSVTFTVTGRSNNASYGAVTPAIQEVGQGGTANLTATAKPGYVIEGWTGVSSGTGVDTGSGTAVVSDVQADRTVVCAFKSIPGGDTPSGGNRVVIFNKTTTSSYPELENGDMVNWLFGNNGSDDNSALIKDVGGNDWGYRNILAATSFRTSKTTHWPDFTGNAGRYPDEYMRVVGVSYSSKVHPEGSVMTFSGITPGLYKVSIFISVATGSTYLTNKDTCRYTVNGDTKSIPADINIENNINSWMYFDDVEIGSDGNLIITLSSTKAWVSIPINAIEIEKAP